MQSLLHLLVAFSTLTSTARADPPACLSPNSIIADPYHCSQFYYCGPLGEKLVYKCPGTMYFNPLYLVCDWPENVHCNNQEYTYASSAEKSDNVNNNNINNNNKAPVVINSNSNSNSNNNNINNNNNNNNKELNINPVDSSRKGANFDGFNAYNVLQSSSTPSINNRVDNVVKKLTPSGNVAVGGQEKNKLDFPPSMKMDEEYDFFDEDYDQPRRRKANNENKKKKKRVIDYNNRRLEDEDYSYAQDRDDFGFGSDEFLSESEEKKLERMENIRKSNGMIKATVSTTPKNVVKTISATNVEISSPRTIKTQEFYTVTPKYKNDFIIFMEEDHKNGQMAGNGDVKTTPVGYNQILTTPKSLTIVTITPAPPLQKINNFLPWMNGKGTLPTTGNNQQNGEKMPGNVKTSVVQQINIGLRNQIVRQGGPQQQQQQQQQNNNNNNNNDNNIVGQNRQNFNNMGMGYTPNNLQQFNIRQQQQQQQSNFGQQNQQHGMRPQQRNNNNVGQSFNPIQQQQNVGQFNNIVGQQQNQRQPFRNGPQQNVGQQFNNGQLNNQRQQQQPQQQQFNNGQQQFNQRQQTNNFGQQENQPMRQNNFGQPQQFNIGQQQKFNNGPQQNNQRQQQNNIIIPQFNNRQQQNNNMGSQFNNRQQQNNNVGQQFNNRQQLPQNNNFGQQFNNRQQQQQQQQQQNINPAQQFNPKPQQQQNVQPVQKQQQQQFKPGQQNQIIRQNTTTIYQKSTEKPIQTPVVKNVEQNITTIYVKVNRTAEQISSTSPATDLNFKIYVNHDKTKSGNVQKQPSNEQKKQQQQHEDVVQVQTTEQPQEIQVKTEEEQQEQQQEEEEDEDDEKQQQQQQQQVSNEGEQTTQAQQENDEEEAAKSTASITDDPKLNVETSTVSESENERETQEPATEDPSAKVDVSTVTVEPLKVTSRYTSDEKQHDEYAPPEYSQLSFPITGDEEKEFDFSVDDDFKMNMEDSSEKNEDDGDGDGDDDFYRWYSDPFLTETTTSKSKKKKEDADDDTDVSKEVKDEEQEEDKKGKKVDTSITTTAATVKNNNNKNNDASKAKILLSQKGIRKGSSDSSESNESSSEECEDAKEGSDDDENKGYYNDYGTTSSWPSKSKNSNVPKSKTSNVAATTTGKPSAKTPTIDADSLIFGKKIATTTPLTVTRATTARAAIERPKSAENNTTVEQVSFLILTNSSLTTDKYGKDNNSTSLEQQSREEEESTTQMPNMNLQFTKKELKIGNRDMQRLLNNFGNFLLAKNPQTKGANNQTAQLKISETALDKMLEKFEDYLKSRSLEEMKSGEEEASGEPEKVVKPTKKVEKPTEKPTEKPHLIIDKNNMENLFAEFEKYLEKSEERTMKFPNEKQKQISNKEKSKERSKKVKFESGTTSTTKNRQQNVVQPKKFSITLNNNNNNRHGKIFPDVKLTKDSLLLKNENSETQSINPAIFKGKTMDEILREFELFLLWSRGITDPKNKSILDKAEDKAANKVMSNFKQYIQNVYEDEKKKKTTNMKTTPKTEAQIKKESATATANAKPRKTTPAAVKKTPNLDSQRIDQLLGKFKQFLTFASSTDGESHEDFEKNGFHRHSSGENYPSSYLDTEESRNNPTQQKVTEEELKELLSRVNIDLTTTPVVPEEATIDVTESYLSILSPVTTRLKS